MIASAGLDGPGRKVVAIRLGDEVGVEFRRKGLRVHCLAFANFFAAFNLVGLSLNAHQ